MICKIYQCHYNISDKHITDILEFTYDGMQFEYDNKLASFEVFYKPSSTSEFKKMELAHYMNSMSNDSKCLYYNDDESGILRIYNNQYLGISPAGIIRVEIRETLGTDGEITISGTEIATFSMYHDAAYNYSGVNVFIRMLNSTTGATDGDTLDDIKKRLIDEKVRRDNITTEHDVITYINDYDANIQLVKKRNDTKERIYYAYSLIRYGDREVAPTTTRPLLLSGVKSSTDFGDFDHYEPTVDRKVLRAYSKFQLIINDAAESDEDPETMEKVDITDEIIISSHRALGRLTADDVQAGDVLRVLAKEGDSDTDGSITYRVVKTDALADASTFDTPEEQLADMSCFERVYYFTCPFLIIIDDLNMAHYYYTSVDTSFLLSMQAVNSLYPYQMITRSVHIYRDSHDPNTYDRYRFTVVGSLNTENDLLLIDEDANLLDPELIYCHIFFPKDGTPVAYLPLALSSYNAETREFTFTGTIRTSDYITENEQLEILEGLYYIGTQNNYNSVIDYKEFSLQVSFMFRDGDGDNIYGKDSNVYGLLPSVYTDQYVLMNSYYNNPNNLCDLVIEYNRYSRSPVSVREETGESLTYYQYKIEAVPFFEFNFGLKYITSLYEKFRDTATVMRSLLKLTTDFEVCIKFISTYGISSYITVTGGKYVESYEVEHNLYNLNPTLYFKMYGFGAPVEEVRRFIYEMLRDMYITETDIFMSNICTKVEETFSAVQSIKFMGIDAFDASYQHIRYEPPILNSYDSIDRYVPEHLSVYPENIQIELDEKYT